MRDILSMATGYLLIGLTGFFLGRFIIGPILVYLVYR